jgi:hypothetical protein
MASVSVAEYHGAVSPAGWYEAASATAVFKSGHKYVGAWKAGKMHGRGRYEWVDGVVFEGYFTDNVAEGHGRYDWPDGGRYEGQIRKGKRHGPGVMFFADGETRYEGDWVEGKRHGRGRLIFSDDDDHPHFYDGEWFNDAKHGRGVFRYPNGDTYEGEWFRDSKHGRGTMRWVGDGRNEMYKGEWKDGKAHGRGAHVWFRDEKNDGVSVSRFSASANTYVGAFVDGKRHGHGVFSYADGAKYVGDFFEDQKHGQGVYAFEDGSAFRGAFERDKPVTPPGDPPFAPTAFLNLDVHDLLDDISHEDADARAPAAAALDKVLLRSMSELRAAYKSAVSRSPPSAAEFADPSSLSVMGFAAFARRRGICGADLTVAQMARAIKPAWCGEERRETHATETKRYPLEARTNQEPAPPDPEISVATTAAADAAEKFFLDPRYAAAAEKDDSKGGRPLDAADPRETPDALSPNATLAFREFVECLVRCAHAKFLATPGLHRRVETLFRENAFVDDADAMPWDAAMASEDVQTVLRGVWKDKDGDREDGDMATESAPPPPPPLGRLHSCFVAASRIRPTDVTRRRDPPAVDGRAFLAFLVSRSVVADADADGEEVTYPPPEPSRDSEPDSENEPPTTADENAVQEPAEPPDEADEASETALDASGAEPEAAVPEAVVLTASRALEAFAAAIAPLDALAEARARAEADEAEAEAAALAAYEAAAEREARREAVAARRAEREAARAAKREAADASGEDAAAASDEEGGADDDDEDAGPSDAELAAAAEAEAKAKAAKKLDVETQALTRVLDCEATFAEFAEALARCADVAVSDVSGDEARTLAEKLDAFLSSEYLDA